MKCDIKIMGSPKRVDNINKMKDFLGLTDSDVFLDDRPNGGNALYTARHTWNLPFENDVTHRCVLQDDLEICEGFKPAIQRIIKAHPDKVICLYTSWNLKGMSAKSPYIKCIGDGVWGQAVILPKEIISKIFEWVDSINPNYPHDDVAIAEYARLHGIQILLTRWSLVQHLCPTKSLLGFSNRNKTSKTYIGRLNAENIFWESKEPMPSMKVKIVEVK